MDGDADVARELERLRAELMDFIVDAVGERMANGDQPELSAALVEAIDRRVDLAVSNRMADVEWPDPERFTDAVLAAASGRSVDADSLRPARRTGDGPRRAGSGSGGVRGLQLGLILLAAIVLTAAATYFVLQTWGGSGATTTNVAAPVGPDPIFYDGNGMQVPAPGNATTPGSAGAAGSSSENVQGPTP